MHRRARVISLTVAALAALAGFSSAALASPVGGSAAGAASGAGKSLTPRTKTSFSWSGNVAGYYGEVSCRGKHQTNEKKGWPGTETEGGREVEKCTSTTGKPLPNMTPGATGQTCFKAEGGGEVCGWESDYFREWEHIGGVDIYSGFSYNVAPNGKSFKIIAVYPFA
ncbi:MAG TPA: hypothetical protein VKG38_01010 [Solirubrobacteraceae bacterium]|nr:hypothetical protein [Solirubrobacteraceae bacterium]